MLENASTPTTVLAQYNSMVARGDLEADPVQIEVAKRLDTLTAKLAEQKPEEKKGLLGRLFGKGKEEQEFIKGLYVWGSVGRGKTMLMDLFYDLSPEPQKRRLHFHEFMEEIHDRVFVVRKQISAGVIKDRDPIIPIAEEIAKNTRLLCFDEFTVTDIADAMLLGRLFIKLFDAGVVLVCTSNVVPDELYKDGLNRNHILPFLRSLNERLDVLHLDAPIDYRLEKLSGSDTYLTPIGSKSLEGMEKLWSGMTYGLQCHLVELENKGRKIPVSRTCSNIAWFTFQELCGTPLGSSDYLRIAHAFNTVFLEGVPALDRARRNEAKRFINLIDTLYDNQIRLVIQAEAEPQNLYIASSGTEAFEFDRTASRLIEMRSEEYLMSGANA
ncbi:cell division protein ZapE [Pseudovibrio sp. Tun.PSC04-5.I4]|uniref:cell division protein ZapE n=1 Tax=Pseudovibrio sp. Tun.PSC04-5.I4 TaxID=1798213 RepID=UPI00088042A4|nr:cell division protein ZapE [Pseudovibrio sp. Tun.PSC04-5.I4]SDR23861.1 cell division protein ZapE [Pseudovibrio sp. Tun.PSC04-5.I4]